MAQTKPPLVTIGLPVYNGERLLPRALNALLEQDHTDFELVISDNASTDDTERICREYASHDQRIRYIRQESNHGGLENFNFVLRQARGTYFMWAAVDDLWAPTFISCLLKSLQADPSAVGAFCPYQLMEEDTGTVLGGVWDYSYADRRPLSRLIKFTWTYRDTCIYGLLRREYLEGLTFIPWGGINRGTPYNLVYPMLYLLLSRGNFLTVAGEPLWFKSVRTSNWHAAPFMANPMMAYVALVVRKINVLTRSAHYIHVGSQSALLAFVMLPFLFLRFLADCFAPAVAAVRIWRSGKKIRELSPHEIWRQGVR